MKKSGLNFQNMTKEQQCNYIIESLEELTADILDLICRIIAYSESGLE